MTYDIGELLLSSLYISAICFFLLWLVSVFKKDASIIDILWGPACALPGFVIYAQVGTGHPVQILILSLVGVWSVRLAWHLARRNLPQGEDIRYTHMRQRAGSDKVFAVRSLVTVYALQCVIAWFISFPVQFAMLGLETSQPGLFSSVGAGCWLVGFMFETVGDYQLSCFKARPENKGKLMDRGLWAWTRHPNYFGDALIWFGLATIALESPYGIYGVFSPIVMAFFLVKVSGKALLERLMEKKYPDYAQYKARTSGFIPMPPKS